MKAQRSKLLRGRQKNDSAGSSVTVMLSTSLKVECFALNQQINSEMIANMRIIGKKIGFHNLHIERDLHVGLCGSDLFQLSLSIRKLYKSLEKGTFPSAKSLCSF